MNIISKYFHLKKTELKYRQFQMYLGKILKVKNGVELYQLETDILCDRKLERKDAKKLNRFCDLKRTETWYNKEKKNGLNKD